MSGHSHFSSIKHKKAITDAKRGKAFSKLAGLIAIASKTGGDPRANPTLRIVIERARAINMPKDKIENAIKRGTGEIEGAQLEEVLYEAFGPGKVGIIIEGITDNKNRTLAEVKKILNQNKGKLATSGSVKWLFERKGCIAINTEDQEEKDKEKLEMIAIDSGAEDIDWNDGYLDVYVNPEDGEQARTKLEDKGISIDDYSLNWLAKETIEINEKDKQDNEKLFEALDEIDDIQNVYSNI